MESSGSDQPMESAQGSNDWTGVTGGKMGQYLSEPVLDQEHAFCQEEEYMYALTCMQGWRRFMEDAHVVQPKLSSRSMSYFGIFDGHSGAEVAKYAAQHLHLVLEQYLNTDMDVLEAIEKAFHDLDATLASAQGQEALAALAQEDDPTDPQVEKQAKLLGKFLLEQARQKEHRPPRKLQRRRSLTISGDTDLEVGSSRTNQLWDQVAPSSAGSTALICLLSASHMYIANVGDSRAVLSRGGRAFALSRDHKPDHATEYKRILEAGAVVQDGRINGRLNVSRALGDLSYKTNAQLEWKEQVISACPEIQIQDRHKEDEFLVLACDGFWECFEPQQVVDYIHAHLQQSSCILPETLIPILQNLLHVGVAPTKYGHHGSGLGLDNFTVLLLVFPTLYNKP